MFGPPEETRFNFSSDFMSRFMYSEIFSHPPQQSNRNKRPKVITQYPRHRSVNEACAQSRENKGEGKKKKELKVRKLGF